MNAAESELARMLSARMGEMGKVSDVTLGQGSVRLTLDLAGQGSPVELHAEGLRWSNEGDQVVIRWDRAGSSLPWVDRLMLKLAERAGNELRIPDSLRLLPIKLLLPRA